MIVKTWDRDDHAEFSYHCTNGTFAGKNNLFELIFLTATSPETLIHDHSRIAVQNSDPHSTVALLDHAEGWRLKNVVKRREVEK
jgi:hypothetical protein